MAPSMLSSKEIKFSVQFLIKNQIGAFRKYHPCDLILVCMYVGMVENWSPLMGYQSSKYCRLVIDARTADWL